MAWEKLGTASVSSTTANTSWKELGRTTLTGTNDSIDVSSFAAKDNLMILCHVINSGGDFRTFWRFNSDTGTNYAQRYNANGGSDATNTSLNGTMDWNTTESVQSFEVLDIINIAAQEKLGLKHKIGSNTAGAGNAPNRAEIVGKWANTSAQITSVSVGDAVDSKSGTGGIGSEVVVLGYDNDEADTGTNFWQELASVELSSTVNTINSGTITAKKYLWVQLHGVASGSISGSDLRFNGDSGSNYARRYSANDDTDGTGTSESTLGGIGTASGDSSVSWFIVNVANKEKLVMGEGVSNTTGAANAPDRRELYGKWANTSDQITSITVNENGSGGWTNGTTLKVYGAD